MLQWNPVPFLFDRMFIRRLKATKFLASVVSHLQVI